MKFLAVFLAGFTFATAVAAQGVPAAAPAAASGETNHLIIIAEIEARYSQTNVVWLGQVRAAEEGFYLECDRLTAIFNTNTVRTASPAGDAVPSLNSTNVDTKFDRVIAEGNVMIITRDSQIIGDHAVYYASNDLLHVTGELVIAANAQGSIVCTNITFARSTGASWVEGANTFIGNRRIFGVTNAPAVRTNAPPLRK